jgi:hypothetical protein
MITFSTFLFSFVDWRAMMSCKDAQSCQPFSSYVSMRPLSSPSLSDCWVFGYFGIFTAFWLWKLAAFVRSAPGVWEMHGIYRDRLRIT